MSDEKPTVINTANSSGGWIVAIVLLIVVIGGAFVFLYDGFNTAPTKKLDVEITVPKPTN